MNGYLDADCVFRFLVEIGFMHNSQWRSSSRIYTAHFWLVKSKGYLAFEIDALDGTHKVYASSVRLLERSYQEDFRTVYTLCSIG